MDGVVGLKNKFVNEIIFSKVTLTMWTLLCPLLEMKTLPVGPQLRGFVGVFIYQHVLLWSQKHWQRSFLSLTCYSILDFHYELKITASEDLPIFLAGSNF
jgi:hypothetical protein